MYFLCLAMASSLRDMVDGTGLAGVVIWRFLGHSFVEVRVYDAAKPAASRHLPERMPDI
jgi:hypothetical protein